MLNPTAQVRSPNIECSCSLIHLFANWALILSPLLPTFELFEIIFDLFDSCFSEIVCIQLDSLTGDPVICWVEMPCHWAAEAPVGTLDTAWLFQRIVCTCKKKCL